MTFDQMRYFMEVSNCLSFTLAAENLYISQPNLTRYIASMEKELGLKLFVRDTHRVELTPAGVKLMETAENLFWPLLRTMDELRSDENLRKTIITIGIIADDMFPATVQNLFREHNLRYPDCRCIIEQDSNEGLLEGLQNRKYDLIFSTDHHHRSVVKCIFNFFGFDIKRVGLSELLSHPLDFRFFCIQAYAVIYDVFNNPHL